MTRPFNIFTWHRFEHVRVSGNLKTQSSTDIHCNKGPHMRWLTPLHTHSPTLHVLRDAHVRLRFELGGWTALRAHVLIDLMCFWTSAAAPAPLARRWTSLQCFLKPFSFISSLIPAVCLIIHLLICVAPPTSPCMLQVYVWSALLRLNETRIQQKQIRERCWRWFAPFAACSREAKQHWWFLFGVLLTC